MKQAQAINQHSFEMLNVHRSKSFKRKQKVPILLHHSVAEALLCRCKKPGLKQLFV
jgi:hypothetical protein